MFCIIKFFFVENFEKKRKMKKEEEKIKKEKKRIEFDEQ